MVSHRERERGKKREREREREPVLGASPYLQLSRKSYSLRIAAV